MPCSSIYRSLSITALYSEHFNFCGFFWDYQKPILHQKDCFQNRGHRYQTSSFYFSLPMKTSKCTIILLDLNKAQDPQPDPLPTFSPVYIAMEEN